VVIEPSHDLVQALVIGFIRAFVGAPQVVFEDREQKAAGLNSMLDVSLHAAAQAFRQAGVVNGTAVD
jgi:hypothetical protein